MSALLPATLTLAAARTALARIGGGEDFHSGREASSGTGDGDDALFALAFDLLRLAVAHPRLGIPLLVIVGLFALWRLRRSPDEATRRALDLGEAERRTAVAHDDVAGWVAALRARDPAFRLEAFLERARGTVRRLSDAWLARTLEPARPLVSDAVLQRLRVQLALAAAAGVRDAVAELHVDGARLVGLEQTAHFEALFVRVEGSARDAEAPAGASDAEAHAVALRAPRRAFVEVWTFLRRLGASTRPPSDGRARCPGCGAPFLVAGEAGRCEHCEAIVNAAVHDWIVTEITQASEHAPRRRAVEGLARARQGDSALALEVLEDRAALCFWRWVEALTSGDSHRLAPVATRSFVAALDEALASSAREGRRRSALQCAVGAVDVRSFVVVDGFDRAHVEVRWSARLGLVPRDASPETARALPVVPQRSVLTLARRRGARTPSAHGLSTARCARCGAPLPDTGGTQCEHCQAALASGDHDWVLAELEPYERWSASWAPAPSPSRPVPLRDRLPDRAERRRLLLAMAAVARADGTVDPREERQLRACARLWGLDDAEVDEALSVELEALFPALPKGDPASKRLLEALVEVALVDGVVDERERAVLEAVARHLALEAYLGELLDGTG